MKWACFNYIEFQLPDDCVEDCSAVGPVDAAAEFWQRKLNLNLDRVSMIKELMEYGAWDESELNGLESSELEMKLIWIGACNISEEGE